MCSGTQERLGQLKYYYIDLQSKVPLNQIYKIVLRVRAHILKFIFHFIFNLCLKKLLAATRWHFLKTDVVYYFAYASVFLQTLSLPLSLISNY